MRILEVALHEFDPTLWGLLGPYEDPALDARTASVFWSPAECTSVLSVLALPGGIEDVAGRLPDIAQTCRVTVYRERKGREHVLFTQDGCALQLEVRGLSILKAGRLLPDLKSYASLTGARARPAQQLADLMIHHALRPHLYPAHGQGRRLAEVLQALDGELVGASRRDIAIALFGEERVRRDWWTRSMRAKVRNAVLRGLELMNGGYKELLK